MHKRKIGISLYPEFFTVEQNKEYIKVAKKLNYELIFMSLLHLSSKQIVLSWNYYVELSKFAAQQGFYIILDIAQETLIILNDTLKDLKKITEIKFHCLRLDSPLMPREIANLTYHSANFDSQLNASNNDHLINNVLDYDPVFEKISACHNFYPQVQTGLEYSFFIESSKKFTSLGIPVGAFVGSQIANHGPQRELVGSLPTLEKCRFLPIASQGNILWASGLISNVIIGNQMADFSELQSLSLSLKTNKIQLQLELQPDVTDVELNIIKYDDHFCRGDINSNFIRSTMTRVIFKNIEIQPKQNNIFEKGDVVIINKNNHHYQGELIIIRENNFVLNNNTGNKVGHIKNADIIVDNICSWSRFEFQLDINNEK